MTTGLFIAFEGGEGAGKSTQVRLLADWLTQRGRDVVRTYEPGDTVVGKRIREILLDPSTGDLTPRAEALLFCADRAEHVETLVEPALARGAVVITDRYVDSSLAYQGAGRALDASLVDVLWWAAGGLRPDLTVLLDLDPETALARFEGRDRMEAEGLDFHRKVRATFLELAKADDHLVLDAHASVEEIAGQVRAAVEALL